MLTGQKIVYRIAGTSIELKTIVYIETCFKWQEFGIPSSPAVANVYVELKQLYVSQ